MFLLWKNIYSEVCLFFNQFCFFFFTIELYEFLNVFWILTPY